MVEFLTWCGYSVLLFSAGVLFGSVVERDKR